MASRLSARCGRRPGGAGFVLLACCLLTPEVRAEVRQDGVDTQDPETRAEAPDRPPDMPLSPLPEPPETRLGPPRPAALEAIDDLLVRIVGDDPVLRERAARALLEAKPDWVSGISRRIDRLADRADRSAQKRLLDEMRDRTRARLRSIDSDFERTPDYLQVALEHADPANPTWQELTQLLALRRMSEAVGTTEAVREIVRIYVRFGEYMRIDCQRALEELGDRAVAGLIEARRHPAPKIAKWAERRLALRKKSSAHEAVRTSDSQALADVLVALGRERDPDSTRLLISFAGTEQTRVRQAARQAIALMGDVASWQLRDAYLDTTGKRPPRDWTWKRTARELFTEFDRLRLERVYRLMEQGRKAEAAEDWEEMRRLYDRALSLAPEFDGRAELAPGYLKFARQEQEGSQEAALIALRRVERIAHDQAIRDQATSLRLLLEARQLREQGVVDRALLSRAARLDPENTQRAEELLAPEGSGPKAWGTSKRYAVGLSVALIALLGASWILLTGWWRRREELREPKTEHPNASP